MSRMNEMSICIEELKKAADALLSVAESLQRFYSAEESSDAEAAKEPELQQEEKTYSFMDVRGILADKSRKGHTAAVKDLLRKYGADKLSDLAPENYAAIVADVEAL